MQDTIYLDGQHLPDVAAKLARAAYPSYRGRKYKVRAAESVDIGHTYWDGGSRTTYVVVELGSYRVLPVPKQTPPQFGGPGSVDLPLRPGIVVVSHSIFCGKDTGLTFLVHPDQLATSNLLPAPVELDPDETIVLAATSRWKASYNGRNRYQMARDCRLDIDRARWDAASDRLKARKLLNKAGAITAAGRNAIGNTRVAGMY